MRYEEGRRFHEFCIYISQPLHNQHGPYINMRFLTLLLTIITTTLSVTEACKCIVDGQKEINKPTSAAVHWTEISSLAKIFRRLRSRSFSASSTNAAVFRTSLVLTALAHLVVALLLWKHAPLLSRKEASVRRTSAKYRDTTNVLPDDGQRTPRSKKVQKYHSFLSNSLNDSQCTIPGRTWQTVQPPIV